MSTNEASDKTKDHPEVTPPRLLIKRFIRTGGWQDYVAAVRQYTDMPRCTLAEYGTDSLAISPEIRPYAHGWVRWQPWLLSEGYALHPRYAPGWVPSWVKDPSLNPCSCNDYLHDVSHFNNMELYYNRLTPSKARAGGIAAVRLVDGAHMWLKRCTLQEVEIMAYLSSQPLRSDPRNHCCPLADILCPPMLDTQAHWILVLPLVQHAESCPFMGTVGDVLQCTIQLAEGLAFMHEQNIAHGGITKAKFMKSQLTPTSSPPAGVNGTSGLIAAPNSSSAPIRYWYIDFDRACRFPSVAERRAIQRAPEPRHPAPEIRAAAPHDPFALDVFLFGHALEYWANTCRGLEFLRPLISELVCDNPEDRLSAAEMLTRLREIASRCGPATTLAPYTYRKFDSAVKFAFLLGVNLAQHYLGKREG
ncbi:hypothetical protein AURDEDRAFT_171373 [Auricularia subglabra TFB-10046 SS5]|uniref:Protein kinase domain-containing protein n=1 Tax=Auricularia subglabra (strain TFB-10046 / SS5) TaxID=717982 RepID=J0WXD5_AURST|nr:hypothetical protein AURDEDRAFT_171373 [Auricularia subglabra TFB-10046 SS5]